MVLTRTEIEIDLLMIERGHVVAPAGCGKTHLIATTLMRHADSKPILILTHTNAGVAALRSRLKGLGVKTSAYQLLTIDGWAIRLITTFPMRSRHNPNIIENQRPNYDAIREAAASLLQSGHISDVIEASYSRLLVDEYQDCSSRQHAMIQYASEILPTCVVGDPMQAIFNFSHTDPLPNWAGDVCGRFPFVGAMTKPWRWINANSEELGLWLLEVRQNLESETSVDLSTAPNFVEWIELDGISNHQRCLEAARVSAPGNSGTVLIIGESTSPQSQRDFARDTPGAITVEALDLRDFTRFAQSFNLNSEDALAAILEFAQNVMTGVGRARLLRRIETLTSGTAQQEPNEIETAALAFKDSPSFVGIVDLFNTLRAQQGVRLFRPNVYRVCIQALQMCNASSELSFYEAAVRGREQNRFNCRSLSRRAVGSTLLLKGLEADVAVILNADSMNAQNLYVAMTRGSKKLVICSSQQVLQPRL